MTPRQTVSLLNLVNMAAMLTPMGEPEPEKRVIMAGPDITSDGPPLYPTPMSADRDRHYYALACPPMNRRSCKACDRSSMGRCGEHRKQDARARAEKL